MGICLLCDSMLDSFGLCPNHCDEIGGHVDHAGESGWDADDFQGFDDMVNGYQGDLNVESDYDAY